MQWQRRQKATCPGCGLRPDEADDFQPDAEICKSCASIEQFHAAATDDGKKRPPRGMKVYLFPNAQHQARLEAREARQAASDARWAALEAQNGDGS